MKMIYLTDPDGNKIAINPFWVLTVNEYKDVNGCSSQVMFKDKTVFSFKETQDEAVSKINYGLQGKSDLMLLK